MQSLKVFTGTYIREDDLVSFEYEVTLDAGVRGTAWVARVMSQGMFRGRTSGVLDHPPWPQSTIEATVRELVEASIRDRVGVG